MTFPLQPLRIPTGWTIVDNDLREVDPPEVVAAADTIAWCFVEDLLHMRNDHRDRVLDVGWYPMCDLKAGRYRLVVYEGDFHGPLLFEFRSRDRLELVTEIERLLDEVAEGRL